tara:strand:+ start:8394 stop:8666 length:273 start_codon:yes stop_codon:yes gene_type:complete
MIDKLLNQGKAFVRLQDIKAKKTDFECTKNTIIKHIKSKFPDPLDQVKVLDMVSMDLQDSLYKELQRSSREYVTNEKALDRIKLLNLKMT